MQNVVVQTVPPPEGARGSFNSLRRSGGVKTLEDGEEKSGGLFDSEAENSRSKNPTHKP